jgi:hypothetical protein
VHRGSILFILLLGPGLSAAETITVCPRSSPETSRALAAIEALDRVVGAARRAPVPLDTLRAQLDRVLALPCLRLAAEDLRGLSFADSEAFVDWWERGGAAWLPSLLDPAVATVPPETRERFAARDPKDPLARLLCDGHDPACGREADGWLARAAAALDVFVLENKARDEIGHSHRSSGAERCDAEAQGGDGRGYTTWRTCLERHAIQRQDLLPLGHVRAPTRGWLVLRGRRGHYEPCETLAAYDLTSGAAYAARTCTTLVLRPDGKVDRAATGKRARTTLVRGRLSVDNLREALWAIVIAPTGQYRQLDAQRFPLPRGLTRSWNPEGARPQPPTGRDSIITSAQTVLDWSWIDEGQVLGNGTLTWPASLDTALEAHAAALVDVAERGLVETCPPSELPRDLPLLLPRSSADPAAAARAHTSNKTNDDARLWRELGDAPCRR